MISSIKVVTRVLMRIGGYDNYNTSNYIRNSKWSDIFKCSRLSTVISTSCTHETALVLPA
jgi:hypothetical protein